MRVAWVVGATVLTCVSACGGARAKAKVSTEAQADTTINFDEEAPLTSQTASSSAQEPEEPSDETGASDAPAALLGARHDVRIQDPKAHVRCQCLAIITGPAQSPGLTWSDGAPNLDRMTQTLVVIESEGVPCSAAKAPPQVSYSGYHREGADIVVDLEPAVAGRPITRGAVIPRPGGGGRVRIAAPRSLPYSKAVEGDGDCSL